jgi:hypothetical protein
MLNEAAFGNGTKSPSPAVRESYVKTKPSLQVLVAELERIARPFLRTMVVTGYLEYFAETEERLLEKYKNVGPTTLGGKLFANMEQVGFEYYSPSFLLDTRVGAIVQSIIKYCTESYVEKFENIHPDQPDLGLLSTC